jgi:hypothetical protein
MLVGCEGKRIGGKGELLYVVEAEEEICYGVRGVVDDLDGLAILSTELHDLWFDCNDIGSHRLAVKIKKYYKVFFKSINQMPFFSYYLSYIISSLMHSHMKFTFQHIEL